MRPMARFGLLPGDAVLGLEYSVRLRGSQTAVFSFHLSPLV